MNASLESKPARAAQMHHADQDHSPLKHYVVTKWLRRGSLGLLLGEMADCLNRAALSSSGCLPVLALWEMLSVAGYVEPIHSIANGCQVKGYNR